MIRNKHVYPLLFLFDGTPLGQLCGFLALNLLINLGDFISDKVESFYLCNDSLNVAANLRWSEYE